MSFNLPNRTIITRDKNVNIVHNAPDGSLTGAPDIAKWRTIITLDNPNAYSTGGSDNFGYAVAVSGNYAVVGAYNEDDAGGNSSGKAYIFNVTSGQLLHVLDNPNPFGTSSNDQFGFAISMSGNHVLVSAIGEDDSGGFSSGKVYVYSVQSGNLLYTINNFNSSGTTDGDFFGWSTAIYNNYGIIGAYREDTTAGLLSGTAYIFNVAGGQNLFTLTNPNAFGTSAGDFFGWSVAIYNDRAIVGATNEDDAGGSGSGKAYIYNAFSGQLLYTLNNPNTFGTSAFDEFGHAVAIYGDRALVSSRFEDNASGSNVGVVYVFSVSTGQLLRTILNPSYYSTGAGDTFGWSVALFEKYAVIGAPGEDDLGLSNSGVAYLFNIETGAQIAVLRSIAPDVFNEFGRSVSVSGNYIVVGSPNADTEYGSSEGAAHVFTVSGSVDSLSRISQSLRI
jgi:hypothetical protein